MKAAQQNQSLWQKSVRSLAKVGHYLAPNLFLKIFGLIIFLLPALYILYFLVFLPVRHYPEILLDTKDTELIPAVTEKDHQDPEFNSLLQQWSDLSLEYRSYNSLGELARRDSIYLALNFKDSTFNLMIKGVNVRRSKIQDFKISKSIQQLKNMGRLASWTGKPFILVEEWASVEKSPIKVKEAPKDTIEAMKYMVEPAPPPIQDVHVSLKFDRHLILHISQIQLTTWRNYTKRLRYEWERLKENVHETIQHLKNRDLKNPKMWINLEIPRDDALAIYRAIPKKVGLVIIY